VEVEDEKGWSLSHEGAFDVLTKIKANTPVKKIYIYNCSRRVSRIEYFNTEGRVAVAAELDKYKQVSEEFYIASEINITTYFDNTKEMFSITLGSVKTVEFSAKQRDKLFVRPSMRGFENIYEIVDGEIIEQSN